VSDFVPIYLDASRLQNKPAPVDAKVVALRHHIVPPSVICDWIK
jgi:hypothetical protein